MSESSLSELSALAPSRRTERHVERDASANSQKRSLSVDLPYRRVRVVLWAVSLSIIALCTFREVWVYAFGANSVLGAMRLISFDHEISVPTWWSTLLLALSAGLLALNGAAESDRRWKPYWFALAALFLFLSLDEAAMIHETFIFILRSYRVVGFLHYPWIIPYAIASVAIGALYIPFLLRLPKEIRWRMFLAGGLYVTSALVLEGVGAHCVVNQYIPCMHAEFVAEESGEIIAIVIFLVALLMTLNARCRAVSFKF